MCSAIYGNSALVSRLEEVQVNVSKAKAVLREPIEIAIEKIANIEVDMVARIGCKERLTTGSSSRLQSELAQVTFALLHEKAGIRPRTPQANGKGLLVLSDWRRHVDDRHRMDFLSAQQHCLPAVVRVDELGNLLHGSGGEQLSGSQHVHERAADATIKIAPAPGLNVDRLERHIESDDVQRLAGEPLDG